MHPQTQSRQVHNIRLQSCLFISDASVPTSKHKQGRNYFVVLYIAPSFFFIYIVALQRKFAGPATEHKQEVPHNILSTALTNQIFNKAIQFIQAI